MMTGFELFDVFVTLLGGVVAVLGVLVFVLARRLRSAHHRYEALWAHHQSFLLDHEAEQIEDCDRRYIQQLARAQADVESWKNRHNVLFTRHRALLSRTGESERLEDS